MRLSLKRCLWQVTVTVRQRHLRQVTVQAPKRIQKKQQKFMWARPCKCLIFCFGRPSANEEPFLATLLWNVICGRSLFRSQNVPKKTTKVHVSKTVQVFKFLFWPTSCKWSTLSANTFWGQVVVQDTKRNTKGPNTRVVAFWLMLSYSRHGLVNPPPYLGSTLPLPGLNRSKTTSPGFQAAKKNAPHGSGRHG